MGTIRSGATTSPDKAIFTTTDWSLLAIISLIWGSAFLSTAIALEGFSAEAVAFLRIALGAAGLALIPSARRRIDREDWLKVMFMIRDGTVIDDKFEVLDEADKLALFDSWASGELYSQMTGASP